MPLGNELVVCELEMLTLMDDENVLHGKESLVDYTQLGTIDSAVLDEWQHLPGTMRETTHVIVQHPRSFYIHLPQYLARMARGFVGSPYWFFVCLPRLLLGCRSPFLSLQVGIPKAMALLQFSPPVLRLLATSHFKVPLFNDAATSRAHK